MEIKHPRRILFLAPPDRDISRVLKDLTGSAPQPDVSGSLAGVSHEWEVENEYYSATLPIWIDEVTDIAQWKADFLKPEAKEVLEAVGGWVYCFVRPMKNGVAADDDIGEDTHNAMKAIEEIIENACGMNWDGVLVGLDLTPQQVSQTDVMEELCANFIYVHADATGINEYGDVQGMEQLKEALQANDWKPQSSDDDDDEHGDLFGGFDAEKAQMNSELWGLKASLLDQGSNEEDGYEGDEEFQMENMEQMMGQLLAIREMSASMPEEQRKAYAARAVNDLMKDI